MRQLCGTRIGSLMGRSKTSCTTRLLNSGGMFGRSVYGHVHMESKSARACLITERGKGKSRIEKMVRDFVQPHCKRIQETKMEPVLASVEPNFLTPPHQVVVIGRKS